MPRRITLETGVHIHMEWMYSKDFWGSVDVPPVPAYWINTHDPVNQDAYVSASVHHGKTWDPYIWDVFVRVLETGSEHIVVDIGANLGYFSLMAASMGARVIAFEPMNRNMGKLASSVARNGFEHKIVMFQNAVSDESGRVVHIQETDVSNQGNGYITEREWRAEGIYGQDFVETVRLDDVVGSRDVTLMKIDVEGFEGAVLNGAPKLLCWGVVHFIVLEFSDATRRNPNCPVRELLLGLERLGYAVSDVVYGAQRLDVEQWATFPPNLLFNLTDTSSPPGARLAASGGACPVF